MKKGKTAKLNGFNDAKVTYGTVDAKEFKSIYLNIQSWVTPKEDFTNWNRIVSNLHRNIKHTVHNNLNNLLFLSFRFCYSIGNLCIIFQLPNRPFEFQWKKNWICC